MPPHTLRRPRPSISPHTPIPSDLRLRSRRQTKIRQPPPQITNRTTQSLLRRPHPIMKQLRRNLARLQLRLQPIVITDSPIDLRKSNPGSIHREHKPVVIILRQHPTQLIPRRNRRIPQNLSTTRTVTAMQKTQRVPLRKRNIQTPIQPPLRQIPIQLTMRMTSQLFFTHPHSEKSRARLQARRGSAAPRMRAGRRRLARRARRRMRCRTARQTRRRSLERAGQRSRYAGPIPRGRGAYPAAPPLSR